ncbi:MAG: LacI family DNA-binding transcriptional regulator, partial [Sphaerochaetaceae bacterium]
MMEKRFQVATIIDVAKEAEVSPATVTHALNGKRPVSEETRQRILAAIAKLGYVANHSASHLRSGQSKIIGCYVVDITENFANQIVKGIEKGLVGSGYSLLFASGVELGGDLEKVLRFFQGYAVDGLLICHHLTFDRKAVKLLSDSTIPIVSINKEIEGVYSIIPDNYSGGMQAADHLVSAGMTHAAMLAGPSDRDSSIQRILGFRNRLETLGVHLLSQLCLNGTYDFQHGYQGAKTLLEVDKRIDGIFCANDFIAAGAITSLVSLGVQVPQDVRILGFDNRDFSGFWSIPISTFDQPLQEMGFMGAGML